MTVAPVALVLLGHGLIGFTVLGLISRRGTMVTALLPALLGLAAGPIGIVVALVLRAVLQRFPSNGPGEEWAALLRGLGNVSDRRTVDRLSDDRIRQPSPAELASFYDMQRCGGVAMRQRVVATVVRSFEPALAPVIARALVDPDQSIRAQAAAAATDFQNRFVAQRFALEAAAAGADSERARYELGMLLADCSQTVIFSDQARATLTSEAIAALHAVRRGSRGSPTVDRRLAELLVASGLTADATALLDQRASEEVEDEASLLCRLDALYRSGEIDRMRAICTDIRATGRPLGAKLDPIVRFWSAGFAPA